MYLLYFIVLTSTLIFIHELGHFFFAKLFGVRVLTFSIGFGPKLIRIRGTETEYCLGLFPFGGFVNMLEEGNVPAPLPPEDVSRTFEAQSRWKRTCIVLAGPMMNLLFPIAISTVVHLDERWVAPPVIGTTMADRPAAGKLQPGDRVLSVGGVEVESFPEIQRIVSRAAGRPLEFRIQREGSDLQVVVTPREEIARRDEVEWKEMGLEERVGRVGIGPSFAAPVIGIPRPDSPAYRAGLRTFDRIVLANGRKIERFFDLVEVFAKNRGETLLLTYLRPVATSAAGGLANLALLEPAIATLTPRERLAEARPPEDFGARLRDVLERTGIESSASYAAFVPEGSSEWKAGLRPGDRIAELDGAPVFAWADLRDRLFSSPSRPHALKWTRLGEPMAGMFQLRHEAWEDEFSQHYERYVFRSTEDVPRAPEALLANPRWIRSAFVHGLEETVDVIRFVSVGILRILQGKISLSSVTGVITIFDVAGEAGTRGPTYFLWAMAVISVNLGIVNLLPIPVLDGGHLLFIVLEALRRRPLALRTRQMASLAGMMVLVLLMALAGKNDIARKWPLILGQVKDLLG